MILRYPDTEGKAFERQRRMRGLSGAQAGKLAGVSQSELSRFELGRLQRGSKVIRLRALLAKWEKETPHVSRDTIDGADVTNSQIWDTLADELDTASRLFRRTNTQLTGMKAEKLGALIAFLKSFEETIPVRGQDGEHD